jgi:hypothetical protein
VYYPILEGGVATEVDSWLLVSVGVGALCLDINLVCTNISLMFLCLLNAVTGVFFVVFGEFWIPCEEVPMGV